MDSNRYEKFGKYDLVRRLAFGGMAEIFLARLRGEEGFAKSLVLKRILPQFGEDEQFVKMFIDEAILAARINHPNVVQLYDFGSWEGTYFISMEYVDGVDLRHLLVDARKRGRVLSPLEVAALGEGAANGLSHAHGVCDEVGQPLNIVHRDVSPHNLMLSRTGEVKVMDFGIAKAEVRATKTSTGTIKGKVAYMAPEHAGGGSVDKRSDQFSLGAVLWEALTGERLFVGDSELELLRNVIACSTRDLRTLRPDVPAGLVDIVERAICSDPAGRYDDLKDMARELAHFRFSYGPQGAVHLGDLVNELVIDEAAEVRPIRQTVSLAMPVDGGAQSPGISEEPETRTTEAHGSGDFGPTEPFSAVSPTVTAPTEPGDPPTVSMAEQAAAVRRPQRASGWLLAGVLLTLAVGYVLSVPGQPESLQTQLVVVTEPPGARIFVNGIQSSLVAPATIDNLPRGEVLGLRLTLPGYRDWTESRAVTGEKDNLTVRLVPLPAPPPAEPDCVNPANGPNGEGCSHGGQCLDAKALDGAFTCDCRDTGFVGANCSTKQAAEVAPAVKRARRTRPSGKLYLRSEGAWLEVYDGRKRLGTTPLNGIQLSAGRHRLKLVNSEAGIEKSLEVEIPSGGVVKRTVGVE